MPYTEEATQPIIERLKLRYLHAHETVVSIHLFLTGRQSEVPVLTTPDEAAMAGAFIPLLSLPDQWNDNDRLVLQLLSEPQVWEQNEAAFLSHIVPMLDMPGSSNSIVQRFSAFTNFLQERGFSPEKIGSMLILHSREGNNMDLMPLKFSPLRKFLQDLLKSTDSLSIQPYLTRWVHLSWNSLFFRLLSKSHPELEMTYLENQLLAQVPGYLHSELANALLQHNYSKYEPLLLQVLQAPTPPTVAVQLGVQLALTNYQPDTYQAGLLPLFRQYLHDYTQQPQQEEGYASTLLHADAVSSYPLSVIALHGILQHNATEGITYLHQFIAEKRFLPQVCFDIIARQLQVAAVPLLLEALQQEYDIQMLLPLLAQFDPALYLEALWPYTMHKLKSVRMAVAPLLAKDPDAVTKAAGLLQYKKAEQRLTASLILCTINTPEARTLIQEALHNEINDDARDLMLETLGNTIQYTSEPATVDYLVASAKRRNKLSRPLEKWLDDQALPPLWMHDGTQLPLEVTRFLIYRMSRIKEMGSDVEAKPLLDLLDRTRNDDFAMALFQIYEAHQGDTQLKYILATAALTGGEELGNALRESIGSWINNRRPRQAEHGLAALALHAAKKSLQVVEKYARKYTTRRIALGNAARQALSRSAAELGLTMHELGDRIVPDLEFEGLVKPFINKDETWKGMVDLDFRIGYLNRRNRRMKTPPGQTTALVKRFFKTTQKNLPELAKLQASRLEQFLITQRSWSAAQWNALFLHNPILFVFANRLVWASYHADGQFSGTFRCTENSTLTDVGGNAFELPEGATVRLLHPLQIDAAGKEQWLQHFTAHNIIPGFAQLERPVSELNIQQRQQTMIYDFEDIIMEQEALNSLMEEKGWKLRTNEESQPLSFRKTDDINEVEAVIELSGIYLESGIQCKLGTLYFIDLEKAGDAAFDSTSRNAGAYMLPLHKVPAVFYSETVTDISKPGSTIELV
ncbi:DUF4132 domain-containing protein [Chitinophaga sp. Cy-1792]|uniref:DUF4132 domain-containing protein n=1 Tax=Chitinophaga sp. Cy-1792 TaxID=2608339 RepID=UPI0014229B8E|nr:DUF4132 domain-containing protein [Chitinophaga sp. Cy-1792]NIG54606.1 DUF4132 domain-containing protein [Chitinophaga sp. Cy-1792]